MKGYGDSDKPNAKSEYDIPLLVEEIHDFLTAIGQSNKSTYQTKDITLQADLVNSCS